MGKLQGHSQCVNSLAWAPHSSCHISTAGDDNQALIWDLSHMPKPIEDPILAYYADAEVNQLQWSRSAGLGCDLLRQEASDLEGVAPRVTNVRRFNRTTNTRCVAPQREAVDVQCVHTTPPPPPTL